MTYTFDQEADMEMSRALTQDMGKHLHEFSESYVGNDLERILITSSLSIVMAACRMSRITEKGAVLVTQMFLKSYADVLKKYPMEDD